MGGGDSVNVRLSIDRASNPASANHRNIALPRTFEAIIVDHAEVAPGGRGGGGFPSARKQIGACHRFASGASNYVLGHFDKICERLNMTAKCSASTRVTVLLSPAALVCSGSVIRPSGTGASADNVFPMDV